MKYFKYFLVPFCACFLLGSWAGYDKRRQTTEEGVLLETAVAHMHLYTTVRKNEPVGYPGTIVYFCNSSEYFIYDMELGDQIEPKHPDASNSSFSLDALEHVFEGVTGIELFELANTGLAAPSEGFHSKERVA